MPKRQKEGLLVGGNCGATAEAAYEAMMDTKMLYGKNWGRQGYHFVLSFPPGEVTAEKAMEITNRFCERYFGEEYDYVTATHDDQEHKHGHIIFNSVSRDGRKYRYERGDWEKYIQRLANEICQEEGLSQIVLENVKQQKSKAADYRKWESQRGCKAWGNLIRQNIDEAIGMSDTYGDFLETLKENGYQIREGNSKEKGSYISLKSEGMERARRNYTLGRGYTVADIQFRIENKELSQEIHQKIEDQVPRIRKLKIQSDRYQRNPIVRSQYQKCYFLCVWNNRIRSPYKQAKPWRYRKDLRELDRHMANMEYTIKHGIRTVDDLIQRREVVEKEFCQLKFEQGHAYRQNSSELIKKVNSAIRKNREELQTLDSIERTYRMREDIPPITENPERRNRL